MDGTMTGQYIPGDSVFHKMHAPTKLLCFFVILAAVILTDSVPGYVLLFLASSLSAWRSGIGFYRLLNPVRKMKYFFLLIFLMNTLFYAAEQAVWSWWIFGISFAGMKQGADIVLRLFFLIVFSHILTATTTPVALTDAIETMLLPLKLIGVPTGEAAMIISVAVRFIPTFIEEAEQIKKAQIARGARFESKRFFDRATCVLPLVVPVFLSAFRRADELSAAMEARGYRGRGGTKKKIKQGLQFRDMQALIICCMICMSQIVL